MPFTTSIPFVSGAYPNQVIPYTDINLLIDNVNLKQKKPLTYYTTTPPTAITQATSGTWATLATVGVDKSGSVVYQLPNDPLLIQFSAMISASAAVANKVIFAWFENGSQVGGTFAKFSAFDTLPHQLLIMHYHIPSTFTSVQLKWQVESATPNVTFSAPNGYRIVTIPV